MQNLKLSYFLFFLLALSACTKNETRYYADSQTPGVAVFSDKNFNLLTCFVNGRQWRTIDRTQGIIGPVHYEVDIEKLSTTGPLDTIGIKWNGYLNGNRENTSYIILVMQIPKIIGYSNLKAIDGKRFLIDTVNSYFLINGSDINPLHQKASGSIYFHRASLDSLSPGIYTGKIAGLFEANFGNFKITNGRFDHFLDNKQINFP